MKGPSTAFLLFLLLAAAIHSQEAPKDVVPSDGKPEQASTVRYFPFSVYQPNYIVWGNLDDQVKMQLSFKYEFLKETGIFFGYRQIVFWRLYDESSPIVEVDLNPELFWNHGDNLNFVQVGLYEHKSNGASGPTSRGWDRSYVQFRVSTGDFFNMGLDVKGFYMWARAIENRDIDDYTGYYEAEIFFRFLKAGPDRLTDKEELYIRGGTGKADYGFDFAKGWIEAGLTFRIVLREIQPRLFVQSFYGYGESLNDYNQKGWSVRAGFVFD